MEFTLSKSSLNAAKCETYYKHYYVDRSPLRSIRNERGDFGDGFHLYRQKYVEHIVDARKKDDQSWALAWLQTQAFSKELREAIASDITWFNIPDPESVFGCEVFLSMDAQTFEPVDCLQGVDWEGGREMYKPGTAHGFIDLLQLVNETAYVEDYKAKYKVEVDEVEATIYAALVFAHFPHVERVEFSWYFVRSGGRETVNFTREQFPAMQASLTARRLVMEELRGRIKADKQIGVDPYAGLCSYCEIDCPLRKAPAVAPPVQTEEDAQALLARYVTLDSARDSIRAALEQWTDNNGPMPVPGGRVAGVKPSNSRSYALPDVLAVLGFPLGDIEQSPKHKVPLANINVSAADLHRYSGAKSRQEMQYELDRIATYKPKSEFTIYKPKQ